MAVLYRCDTPTNWLCPCGRVARELRKHGIEHEEIRTGWRAAKRTEVKALSGGQGHVPMVVIDGEAICDSNRIVEHLRWRAEGRGGAEPGGGAEPRNPA